jgi:hypothetical protein
MVSTVTSYLDSRNRAIAGEGYDGVVKVSTGGYYGTGVLLYNGRAVLTSAHLFSAGGSAAVQFETKAGSYTLNASRVSLHPAYDPIHQNNDLALIWLAASAPVVAERYELYRGSNEIGQRFTLVGYGVPGSGASGELTGLSGGSLRLKADNQFDADVGTLKSFLGSWMAWSPLAGTQLIADFDDGTVDRDALGRLIYKSGGGLGQAEGLITQGDSGGPAFIGKQIAGIASYVASLSKGAIIPDLDNVTNSSFGEIAAWQRVSHYQSWIDQSLRAAYVDAPQTPAEVKLTVQEGNSGVTLTYFLLQFTGMRSVPGELLQVDYVTRDGTAKAGQDYLATSGTLRLYGDENHAVIAVEILGDNVVESNETFFLDVINPVGGSFGDGIIKLSAMRTIINDDGAMWG